MVLMWFNVAVVAAVSLILCVAPDGRAGTAKGRESKASTPSIYDFTVKDIDGTDVKLSKYEGDVLLIVNVASK